MKTLRLIVGSTHRDLATERILVQEVLEALAKETEGFSYFAPRSQPRIEDSLSAMENSDLALFILGHCYGAMVPGGQFSHAETEYQAALKRGIPILSFLRREDFGMLPGQFEREPARIKKIGEFRARLKAAAHQEFTDAPSLSVVLRRALDAEIANLGLIKKFPTRSVPKISFGGPAATSEKSVPDAIPADAERPTRTLPLFQKALSTPYNPQALWPKTIAWRFAWIAIGVFVAAGGVIWHFKNHLPSFVSAPKKNGIATALPMPAMDMPQRNAAEPDAMDSTVKPESAKSDTIILSPTADTMLAGLEPAFHGDAAARFALAERYATGKGLPRNDSLAFKYFLLAAKQGYAEAQYRLGVCYREGQGTTPSRFRAHQWFMAAALKGIGPAQSALGQMYLKGEGTKRNPGEGYKWLLRAAEKKDSSALHILAELKQED